MKFYLMIGKSQLSVFKRNGNSYEPEYIDGNPCVEYASQKINQAVNGLFNRLLENYNLDASERPEIVVIESQDEIRNTVVVNELRKRAEVKVQTLENLLKLAIGRLIRDKSLRIDELGVNYDDNCFRLRNGALECSDFSLTAYTLPKENLLAFIG